MKIIVVNIGEIMHCPPALSLAKVLTDIGHDVLLYTVGNDKETIKKSIGDDRIEIEFVNDDYDKKVSKIEKFKRMIAIRTKLWKKINSIYDDNTIIWVVGEETIKHLGYELIGKRYILHFLELDEGIYYISGNPMLRMDHKKLAANAYAIVEAEYNRAHILKAWWGLKYLPFVYPNKPYNSIQIHKRSQITSSNAVKQVIDANRDKKIILYQGNISKERPLEEYIKAVGELGMDFCFILMINGENPYKQINYPNYHCLPFINPPFHLEVTSNAYIGILSYTPIKNSYSILNTVYCAPNKIWEYAYFGLPMISNDLPGLNLTFNKYKMGKTIDRIQKEDIKKAILEIDANYEEYEKNSRIFFESVDLKSVASSILRGSMH